MNGVIIVWVPSGNWYIGLVNDGFNTLILIFWILLSTSVCLVVILIGLKPLIIWGNVVLINLL